MRILLEEELQQCTTLDQLRQRTIDTLRQLRAAGHSLHYFAGPISCDGEEQIPDNLRRLVDMRTSAMYSLGHNALSFAAPFIFTPEVYSRLGIFTMERTAREAALGDFWDGLLESGVIDVIHLTPGWGRSPGTQRERRTAERSGVRVAYVSPLES